MIEDPVVSVNVPVYQHEPFLEQCLESILNQKTNFPFEIVIGEDESSDRSREICLSYKERYPEKINLILNKRADVVIVDGIPTGRYNGYTIIKNSRGKYIALLEGDDYWESSDKLQKQVDFLEANPDFSGAYHDTYKFYENEEGQEVRELFRKKLPTMITVEDTLKKQTPFHTSSFMFRREYLLEFPEFLWRIHSADMAMFSILAKYGPLGYVPELYSNYRNHFGGITKNKQFEINFHKNRIKFLEEMDEYHSYKFSDKVKELKKFHKSQIWEQKKVSIKRMLKITK